MLANQNTESALQTEKKRRKKLSEKFPFLNFVTHIKTVLPVVCGVLWVYADIHGFVTALSTRAH